MTENGLRLLIWDVDGTLVDSREIIQACMEAAFRASGLAPPDYEATRKTVGLGLAEACARLAPPDLSQGDLEELVGHYKAAFISHRQAPGPHEPLYPGALETLERLRDDGWFMAIATGKSHRGLEAFFERHPLRHLFDTAWCADDGPGKPHPFMVEQAMRALGCTPEASLMIGDAVHDMQMARSADVRGLGVSWGFGRTEELFSAGAEEVHHDFTSLSASLLARGA